jgi:hypothetical protein
MSDYEIHDSADKSCPGCNVNDLVRTLYDRTCPDGQAANAAFLYGLIDAVAMIASANTKPGKEGEMVMRLTTRLGQAFAYSLNTMAESQAKEARIQ